MADIKIYGKLKNATESGKVANYSDIDGAPEIVQETGQSTEKTMSQKAITDAINAGGGGGSGSASDGFNNLKALNLTPTTYQGTESPSGKFAFRGTGGYTLKDNSSGTITTIVQLPVVPGEGIRFAETADGNCEISATGGTSTFPAVDLTNATVPGLGEFTKEQADLLYYVNNKTSFIAIQDTINGLATYIVLPLVYLDSVHNYYTYEATVSGNKYTLNATLQKTTGDIWGVKTYSISKTVSSGGALYMHSIAVKASTANTFCRFEVYSNRSTAFTLADLTAAFAGKSIHSGSIRQNSDSTFYPVSEIQFVAASSTLSVKWISKEFTETTASTFSILASDTVTQVM